MAFDVKGNLQFFPGLEFLVIPTSAATHPGESFLCRGVDEHDMRAQVVPASFKQHRCVDDHGKTGARQPSCDPLYLG